MKKIIITIALIIVTQTINAQISISQTKTIGYIKNGSEEDARLAISGNNITLTIMGVDINKQWSSQSIRFTGTESDLTSLYDAISTVFAPENKKNGDYSLELTLGTDIVKIENKKMLGNPYVVIGIPGRFNSRQLTKGQINQLFGK